VPEEVAYYCVNSSCPAQLVRNVENFASRGALDITGLGSRIVAQLVESGLVCSAADLYSLNREELLRLEKFGEKKADNLLQAIEASKSQALERLIIGLGIHGVGEVAARKLARTFYTLDALSRATLDELTSLEGIGPSIAASITGWFAQAHNQELLQRLREAGFWPQEEAGLDKARPKALEGRTFVITGTLPTLSRERAEQLIQDNGGTVSSSVSKKTSYLVLGDNPGSKYTKALELGIPILDEEGLKRIIVSS